MATKLSVLTLAAAMTFSLAACEPTPDQMRPDKDRVLAGDHGPQSADLREMASRLAPQLLQCREIVQNPNRAVIVVMNMDNQTEDMKGKDLNIYLAKLAGDLGSFAASDRVAFVENRGKTNAMVAQEIGTSDPTEDAARTGIPGNTTRVPQYFLYGTVFSMNSGRTSYYLFQFKLTKANGDISWTGQYDVRTLN